MSFSKHKAGAAVALALSATLLAGCLPQYAKPQQDSANARDERAMTPDWITQLPQRNGMAYGVGSMEIYGSVTDAIKRAGDLARVDLVSQLRVTVSGDFSVDTRNAAVPVRPPKYSKTCVTMCAARCRMCSWMKCRSPKPTAMANTPMPWPNWIVLRQPPVCAVRLVILILNCGASARSNHRAQLCSSCSRYYRH